MAKTTSSIIIPQIEVATLEVTITGTRPLIMHKWSTKAKRMMLQSTQGKKTPREAKNPEAEYEATIHRLPGDRYGFPILGFKAATVRAGKLTGAVMTELRQTMFFRGEMSEDGQDELAPVTGTPRMREDPVRVGRGGAELRYRAQFDDWTAQLVIDYFPSMLATESLISLINFGGQSVGVGDWRPEKSGSFGTYQVDDQSIQVTERKRS